MKTGLRTKKERITTVTRVLDAYGLLAFLEKEPGYERVQAFIIAAEEDNNKLLRTSVNYGEVYYRVLRKLGAGKAEELDSIIHGLPIDILDVDKQLAKEAARFADCFAAALAKVREGEVETGDKEFGTVKDEVKIAWIV